jgi:hypothetical protein
MQLMEHSKTWIAAEDLDARIEYALDNPVRLSGTVPPAEEQKQRPIANNV